MVFKNGKEATFPRRSSLSLSFSCVCVKEKEKGAIEGTIFEAVSEWGKFSYSSLFHILRSFSFSLLLLQLLLAAFKEERGHLSVEIATSPSSTLARGGKGGIYGIANFSPFLGRNPSQASLAPVKHRTGLTK